MDLASTILKIGPMVSWFQWGGSADGRPTLADVGCDAKSLWLLTCGSSDFKLYHYRAVEWVAALGSAVLGRFANVCSGSNPTWRHVRGASALPPITDIPRIGR